MTEPTRAIAKLLWMDFAAMAKISTESREFNTASEYSGSNPTSQRTTLFTQKDIEKTLARIETLDFRETLDYQNLGVSVTAYAAGHVLGACMFCVEILGVNILYTGTARSTAHTNMYAIRHLCFHQAITAEKLTAICHLRRSLAFLSMF